MEPITSATEESTLSNQVCLSCKARKRKCSKTKPSCDLCRKLLVKCIYGAPIAMDSSISFREDFQERVQSNSSISDWPASTNFFASITKQYREKGSPSSNEVHRSTMKEVLRILMNNGATIPTLFSEYFRTMGMWLPAIVSEKALYKQLQKDPSSEVALLILSMLLSIQAPVSSNTNRDFPLTPIYFASKSLLSALLGAGALSLEIVQSYVLISLYEAGQGLLDQARVSTTICTQIGMRLLLTTRSLQLGATRNTDEEKVWSCVLMLERFICFGLPANEISYAANRIWDEKRVTGIKLPPSPTSLPDSGSAEFDRCRSFQRSVDLVGEVFDYLKNPRNERQIDTKSFTSLDEELKSLLGQSLRNSFHSWEESCESIGLLFSSLLAIHKARYDMVEADIKDQNSTNQKQLASMAIHSIIKMLLDISRDFNSRVAYIDIPAIPLPSTFSIYQAAMLHILFADHYFGTEPWNEVILSFRASLVTFGRRWSIADQYVKDIDNALQEKTLARAMMYGVAV